MVEQRRSAAQRGYGYKWQQARVTWLNEHPLCADHLRRGLVAAATVVDHIVPHRGDLSLFWDRKNWQSLCADCHDIHKQRAEHGHVSGCDVGGVPLDAAHHWNLPRGGKNL